jgi:hypothetical protein
MMQNALINILPEPNDPKKENHNHNKPTQETKTQETKIQEINQMMHLI